MFVFGMHRPTRLLTRAAAATAACIATVLACTSATAEEPTARALFEACQMRPRVESTGTLVGAGLAAQRGELPTPVLARLEARVAEVYAAAKLEAAVLSILDRSSGSRHLDAALLWCSKPFGQRILAAEAAASGIEAALEIQDFARRFDAEPPTREQMLLESRYETATKSTELRVALAAATSIAIANAFDASQPEDRRAGPDAIRAGVAESSAGMSEVLRPVSAIEFLYTYRDFTDAEITQYLEFLESDAGRWSLQTRNGSYLAAMLEASESLGAAH
jgi:hypothetical protein